MENFIAGAVELGGTVFTVVVFVWYLLQRDKVDKEISKERSKADIILAKALQELSSLIKQNTVVTQKTQPKLIENTKALDKNTIVMDKNIKIMKQNGNAKK